jgi:hypothetical protein
LCSYDFDRSRESYRRIWHPVGFSTIKIVQDVQEISNSTPEQHRNIQRVEKCAEKAWSKNFPERLYRSL